MSLRIIGGEFRRRQLKTPPGRTTRPYTDRVRQRVFDRLGEAVDGARVADVFSGVGTMGLEALSRGADSCVFIEGDPKVHEVLSANVALIATNRTTLCWKTNIHRTSFRPNGAQECLPYSLVFFDPPYDQARLLTPREALGKSLVRLAKDGITTDDAIVILRTPGHFQFSNCPAWNIDQCWRISTMNLWILHKSGTQDRAPEDPDTPENG
ncbi:MAG: RsmD family RNA methyltransferase [Fuerstiella sp.]